MKKLLSIILCIMMVVTMIPATAFAEENMGGKLPPEPLFWAAVPDNSEDGEKPAAAEWSAESIPITAGQPVRVYFGIMTESGIQPINVDPMNFETSQNAAIKGRTNYIYKLTAEESSQSTWVRYITDTQDYEVGVTVTAAAGGDSQMPEAGQLYFIYAGEKVSLTNGNWLKINGNTYQGDSAAISNIVDQWGVTSIHRPVGGTVGYFTIKENGTLLSLSGIQSSNPNVVDIRKLEDGSHEIQLKNAGTAVLTQLSDDKEYRWTMNVTVTVEGLNIRGGGYTAMAGSGIGNGIFRNQMEVYDGDRRLEGFEEDSIEFTVRMSDESIGEVGVTTGNTIEFIPKAAGETKMIITYKGVDYEYYIRVRENDLNGGSQGGGNGSEEKWTMIFSPVIIDDGNMPQNLQQTNTGVRIGGVSNAVNYYLYLVRFDDNENILELEPVTTTNFQINYLRGILDNGQPDHITGDGVKFTKADDGIDGTGNYYRIATDATRQPDYDKGNGMYDVWPRAEGDNRLIYNSWIDTRGSGNQQKPYDIFVLSTMPDLETLDRETVMAMDDVGVIDASLTHEYRTFTGYGYVATCEFVDGEWIFSKFRKLQDGFEQLYIDYSAGDREWISELNGKEIYDFEIIKNSNGTYTFKYYGPDKDDVKVNVENSGNRTYGYSVGVYKLTPEGFPDADYCRCMPFQFAAEWTAPVIPGIEYDLVVEQLRDPSDIQKWPFRTDYMCVNGQGSGLMFNSRITSWYASFFVRNTINDYDARYIKTPDTNEIRTYVGAAGQYVLEAREAIDGAAWIPIEQIPEEFQVFSLEYIGAKKGFYPVVKVEFDLAKDDANKVTDRYQFRIRYTGADPYLDNGNPNNRRIIELYRDENMVEFDIDEYWWNDVWKNWNTGNVLHFDYIGTAIKTKLNIRPGVMLSVADKTWYDVNDYIFVEDEAENIRFYASWRDASGRWQRKLLDKYECPFTVTWNSAEKVYIIKYAFPHLDKYGPRYEMCYTGDFNSKINAVYGYEEGTVHNVQNSSSMITGKMTLHVNHVPNNGYINATTNDDVLGTEVILNEGAVGDEHTELEIDTNDGSITLGGTLVGNIRNENGKVHFKMWNVKEEKHYINEDQNEEIEKAEKAFDFKIDTEDADIEFGKDGYAVIRIPYDGEEGYIYYINEKGEKEYVDCVCKDGYIEFTARHFSVYAISDEAPENLPAGPVIIKQPEDAEAVLGEEVTVSVEAEGEGLKYQWYLKNKGSETFSKSSICDAVYTVEMTKARAGREVYCVITDAKGNKVTTNTVTLTRVPAQELKILQQPQTVYGALGQEVVSEVVAQGEGIKYQWYLKNAGSENFARSSVRDSDYDVVMTKARAGREIYCVITDALGNKVTTDTVKLIRVPSEPLEITKQPEDVKAVLGEILTTSVEAKGEGLKYQWYLKNKGSETFSKSSIRSAVYEVEMTKERAGREIYCVITDALGNKVQTDTVTLTRAPKDELMILQQPVSAEGVSGEMVTVEVKAQGEGLKYQWYIKNKGSETFARSSTKTAVYEVEMNKSRAERELYCVITDDLGNKVTTETVKLTLKK